MTMFTSAFLVFLALLTTPGLAGPLKVSSNISFTTPKNLLCQIPVLKRLICPSPSQDDLVRMTPLGRAKGTVDPGGAYRFVVKYANSERWKQSSVVSTWSLPTGSSDVTDMPLACPQPFIDSSGYNEDCLSMILYVPPSLVSSSSAPTLMWIHGGSLIAGSASAAELDGSSLAIATKSIIAVVQYRLGALGFMAPNGTTNLAVQDLVNALHFLKKVLPAFRGGRRKITIAGQSSGASLVRTLLAVPSASSLFRYAIIQSDPMDMGFLSTSAQQSLQLLFNDLIACNGDDIPCQNSLSLTSILDDQMTLFQTAFQTIPVVGQFEPMRPVLDGSFITTSLDSTTPFPKVSKPVLISTVAQEAGPTVYDTFPKPLNQSDFIDFCETLLGPDRARTILSSKFYSTSPDSRIELQTIGTDYSFRCPSWTFARNWATYGGPAYVGEYVVGATHPANAQIPYCTQPCVVCHQDDIEIVFGTVPDPSIPQKRLISEMQTRYQAFLHTGSPNAPALDFWKVAGTSDVNPVALGGSGPVPTGACDPSFWGQAVPYDYQVYANA